MFKLGNKIEKILGIDEESFSVTLRFSDKTGTVPLADVFSHPKGLSAEILRGGMFPMCFVENGALGWPNGFELCPDMLYMRLTAAATPRKGKPASTRNGRVRQ